MQRLHSRTRQRRRSTGKRLGTQRSISIQPLENRKLLAGDIYATEALQSDQPALVSSYAPTARIVNGQTTDGFEAVGIVNGGCSGTLISPTHVLTAAHCTVGTPESQMSFQVDGQTYQVSQETHTSRIRMTMRLDRGFDLAIMTLDRAVVGIDPYQILRTAPQLGQMLTLVGFGEGGTSDSGSLFDFRHQTCR